jgi:hypothetical protein
MFYFGLQLCRVVYAPNNTYLTDICFGEWWNKNNVGGYRRPDISFKTKAIWPYWLVHVCVFLLILWFYWTLFSIYGFCFGKWLSQELSVCIYFFSNLLGIVNIHVLFFFFYSFEGVMVDSLEAKEVVSRCACLLP